MNYDTSESLRELITAIGGTPPNTLTGELTLESMGVDKEKLTAFDFTATAPNVPKFIWPKAFSSWKTVEQMRKAVQSLASAPKKPS